MKRAEIIFPALLLVLTVALVLGGWMAGYSWSVIVFPLGVGIFLCGLCAMQIAAVLAGRSSPIVLDEAVGPLTPRSVAWVFALAPFIAALGFIAGPALYLLAYLRANGSSWRLAGAISALSVVVTWGVFIRGLQVLLPIEPFWWPW